VTVQSPEAMRAVSQNVDRLLAEYWEKNNLQGALLTDDASFLRRSYLRIIGRIPTESEARSFLARTDLDKRADLIDHLLDSPGYVSHQFNFWADVFRIKTTGREGSLKGGVYYAQWFKEHIIANTPYDQIVRSLLTAEGYPWENPASGYYLRDLGMPLDNMAMTLQIFMGTQLQCAQCHDHPYAAWTQKDFYHLAAFTAGVETQYKPKDIQDPKALALLQALRANPTRDRKNRQRAIRTLLDPLRWGVYHSDRMLYLPEKSNLDAPASAAIEPQVPAGVLQLAAENSSQSKVQQFAAWMTSESNPRFAIVVANRMWKQVMGQGLIEPVDNFQQVTDAVYPELLQYLAKTIQWLDYDLKAFLSVLYATEFYQRKAIFESTEQVVPEHLVGPSLERMRAEQIWDSLVSILRDDVDQLKNSAYQSRTQYAAYQSGQAPKTVHLLAEKSVDELVDLLGEIAVLQPKIKDLSQQLKSAKRNSQNVSPEEIKRLQAQLRSLRKAQNTQMAVDTMAGASMGMNSGSRRKQAGFGHSTQGAGFAVRRASELPSPSANGHPLEVFGQSDRLSIENANRAASIPQALFLMNSPQTNQILAQQSMLGRKASRMSNIDQQLEVLYLGFLSRQPQEEELDFLRPLLIHEPEKVVERTIWALVNSQEFKFIR
tara:strand:- start:3078 stop:5051 length:1974 start_codon:yes stop_codon:yes gene_type:complete